MSKVGFVELTCFSLKVTEELLIVSLVSFVSHPDYNPLLNTDIVVTLSERMQHLESFLETIPEQFRSPLISKRSLWKSREEINCVFVAKGTEEHYPILGAKRRWHPPYYWSGLMQIRAELILFWEETLHVPVLNEERDKPPIPNEILLSFTNRHDLKHAINSVIADGMPWPMHLQWIANATHPVVSLGDGTLMTASTHEKYGFCINMLFLDLNYINVSHSLNLK
jgi:hypothetical protein